MALWWVALAQLRLAPIQVMGLGHPASSHSPEIDYVLADRGMIEDTSLFTERVLELPPNAFRFIERADTVVPDPYVRQENDPIRVAVPSMVVKVTVPFLQVCRHIDERATELGRKVEWHFFPNVLGVWRFQAKRQLDRWLPGAIIHHRLNYPDYLALLAKCDLHLSTFPFGGTNSLVDSMLCGVPIVCMEGDHVHERCDAWALRRVHLDSLIAHSTEEYENTVLDLIEDDALRGLVRDGLRAVDVRGEFFGALTGDAEGAVLRAFEYVFEHHESIQASPDRVVNWEVQR
jgi:hypothetical protein